MVCTRLGTSMPTTDFPGTGAWMRTLLAAKCRAMSSDRLVMRLTLTPGAGVSS